MIYNYKHKIAKRTNDSDEAVFRDRDIFSEHENPVFSDQDNEVEDPVADESQESHSPSPSFCLCNAMALC